jgi:hypothetical protein
MAPQHLVRAQVIEVDAYTPCRDNLSSGGGEMNRLGPYPWA